MKGTGTDAQGLHRAEQSLPDMGFRGGLSCLQDGFEGILALPDAIEPGQRAFKVRNWPVLRDQDLAGMNIGMSRIPRSPDLVLEVVASFASAAVESSWEPAW